MPDRTLKSTIIFFIILLIPAIFLATTEKEQKKSYDLKSWIDGPVRYIATYNEVKEFKGLKTDQERNNFIYKFWQRRDPSILTLKNEFREKFWEKVIASNQLFTESTKPGWMTDRGKIYIIAGPPNEREYIDNPDASTGMDDMRSMGDSGHRGIERWTYQGLPGLKSAPVITVSFLKDSSGEFRLSSNPDHFDDIAPGIVPPSASFPNPFDIEEKVYAGSARAGDARQKSDEEKAQGTKTLESSAPSAQGAEGRQQRLEANRTMMSQFDEIERLNALTQFQFDIAEITDTPKEEEILKARVKTLEFYEPVQRSITTSYFEDASGKPYLILSVATNLKNYYKDVVPENAVIPLSVFGNLQDANDPQKQFLFSSDATAPSHIVRDKDDLLLLSALSVLPGTYDANLGVQDLLSGRISLFASRIQVPAFEQGHLSLSDIVLASKIAAPEEGAKAIRTLIPGSLKTIPRVKSEYTRSEEFTFFFQIYEAGKDAASGQPNLEITLQFYRWANNAFEKIGKPVVASGIATEEYGRSFPLQNWPVGKFRMQVSVKDNVSSLTASKEVEFEVK